VGWIWVSESVTLRQLAEEVQRKDFKSFNASIKRFLASTARWSMKAVYDEVLNFQELFMLSKTEKARKHSKYHLEDGGGDEEYLKDRDMHRILELTTAKVV
jgi:hypothetical protein